MESILQVNNLHKHFQQVQAVDGISFSITAGKCLGLLGPNGAGKTTTVEMLEGISQPDQGEILYKGEALGKGFRDRAGIMFQSTALQDFITVRETLTLFGQFYPRTLAIADLVEMCALAEFLDRDARKLSGGQRQRLLLAIALINDPEILFLDEPTTGLDPQARHNFWNLVQHIKQQGKTIVLTTHYMEEAYVLCDDIAIMDHGRIIAMGTPRELLAKHFDDVVLSLPSGADVSRLKQMDDVDIIQRDSTIELTTGDVNLTVKNLLQLDFDLTGMQIRQRTLEDLFLELTGKELRQ
ncbi:MAG: ABC transporter ATP-binding protein [Gammaproteobacteria bacterium]|nr:ABC transporter ATP-binding protein [Gammaproteobacteria bacterium]